MKIIVISQVFYPDNVAVSQILSDLCFAMVKRGHEVTVITSRFSYEDKDIKYPSSEIVNNVNIKRIWGTGFGKKYVFFRLSDFFSFNISVFIHLLALKQRSSDLILGLTAPPLLSYFGVYLAKWKSIRFCYWIMDLQPELAIHSGLIGKKTILAKILVQMSKAILKYSAKVIVLDRFMKEYLLRNYRLSEEKVSVVPVWPVVEGFYSGLRSVNSFRLEHGFGNKIVIMYSGNHSLVHPLDTLLDLAKELRSDDRFLFVFVGGGVRKCDVTEYKIKNSLENIIQIPYQPRDQIYLSLGASDFQVVILGDRLVGFTHPNKIYGALFIGKPIIYIGPEQSHITEIFSEVYGNIIVKHGEVILLKNKLLEYCKDFTQIEKIGKNNQDYASVKFAPDVIINEMCVTVESVLLAK
jgi:glycosyltransferase involved in cell wall biosynthesis